MEIFNSSGVLKKDVSIVSRKIISQFNSLGSVSAAMKLVSAVSKRKKKRLHPLGACFACGVSPSLTKVSCCSAFV
jgi:hypothetical protein